MIKMKVIEIDNTKLIWWGGDNYTISHTVSVRLSNDIVIEYNYYGVGSMHRDNFGESSLIAYKKIKNYISGKSIWLDRK